MIRHERVGAMMAAGSLESLCLQVFLRSCFTIAFIDGSDSIFG